MASTTSSVERRRFMEHLLAVLTKDQSSPALFGRRSPADQRRVVLDLITLRGLTLVPGHSGYRANLDEAVDIMLDLIHSREDPTRHDLGIFWESGYRWTLEPHVDDEVVETAIRAVYDRLLSGDLVEAVEERFTARSLLWLMYQRPLDYSGRSSVFFGRLEDKLHERIREETVSLLDAESLKGTLGERDYDAALKFLRELHSILFEALAEAQDRLSPTE